MFRGLIICAAERMERVVDQGAVVLMRMSIVKAGKEGGLRPCMKTDLITSISCLKNIVSPFNIVSIKPFLPCVMI
jgi:hypothetical protein